MNSKKQRIFLLPCLFSILALSVASATAQASCASSGLVSWWQAEGNANDDAGRNNGTLMNATAFSNGKIGKAFGLHGGSDYVAMPNAVNNWPQGSIEGWVKYNTDNPTAGYIFAATLNKPLDGKYDVLNIAVGDGTLRFGFWISGSLTADSGVKVAAGQWYHVVGTWGGGGIRIYVNGALKGQHPYAGPSPASNYNMIGTGSWPGNSINGSIDELKIYDCALSGEEVKQVYLRDIEAQYLQLSGIPDITGDGVMDQAVIYEKTGSYYLKTLDSATGKMLKQTGLGLSAPTTPGAIASVGQQISILVNNPNGASTLQLRDKKTLALLKTLVLSR